MPYFGVPLPLGVSIPSAKANSREGFLEGLIGGRDEKAFVYRYSGTTYLNFEVKEKSVDLKFEKGKWKFSIDGKEIHPPSKGYEGIVIDEDKAHNSVAFVPSDTEFLNSLENRLRESWEEVEKSGAHSKVPKEVINKTIDENFTEIIERQNELYARKEVDEEPYYIRVRDLGDGIEKTVGILTWIEATSPELLLWDDFEASAHPTLVRAILEWISKKDLQVVLSTHSIDVLYELVEIKPEDTKILQLRKDESDILFYESLDVDELEDYIDANQDPRLLVERVKK